MSEWHTGWTEGYASARAEMKIELAVAQGNADDNYKKLIKCRTELAAAREENERLLAATRADQDTVKRVWQQLGSPTYEQLNGRSIHDLIDELKVSLATERNRADANYILSKGMVEHVDKADAELVAERERSHFMRSIIFELYGPIPREQLSKELLAKIDVVLTESRGGNE